MEIGELELKVKSESQQAASGLDALKKSLEQLKGVAKGGSGLTSTINGLTKLGDALNSLNTGNLSKLSEIGKALEPLKNMKGLSSFSSTIRQLKTIPKMLAELDKVDMVGFRKKMQEVATAMRPLASEMDAVARGFSAFPANIQKYMNATSNVPARNEKVKKSFIGVAAKIGVVSFALRRATGVIAGWITESNKYIENMNLFAASMGEFGEEAQKYAEEVGEIMGIDPGEWMRNQGVFMTLATGFGVAGERAALMSKNLTQLGYDLSSFFNISVTDAMQKLQSGLSGELEPLRRLGFDLSQAKLESIALSKGITKSYREMDQAQKSQLRYYAILTQVTTAQGDMARTLEAPANQIRILKAQIVQAARALGNIFIPALNAVLPYLIAFTKAIRLVAQSIAELFGFKMPEIKYDKMESGFGGVEDSIDGATGAAGKFKKMLLGIDELNVLPDKNAGGGAGGLGGDDGWKDFKLPEYNFIGDAINNKTNEILNSFKPLGDWVKENLNVFETFGEIDFSVLSDSLKGLGEALKPLTRSVFDGIAWAYENIFEPIAHWTAEDFLPSFIDALSSTIDLLNETIEIFKPLGEWFWEEWLKPLGEWTGGAIVDTLNFLDDSLSGLTSWAKDNEDGLEPIVTSIGKLMVSLFMISSPLTSTIVLMRNLAKAFKWIENAALTAWQHIKEFFSPAVEWFSKLFGEIKDTVSSAFEVIGDLASGAWEVIKTAWSKASGWFSENFIEPISDAFSGLWGKVKQGASDAWEGIKEFFEPAKEWFKEKFGSIWEDIIAPFKEDGNIFVNIRDGVANLFKKIVNGLITGINNVISKPFNVINNILTGIRDTEIFGFKPFKNLGTINVPSIPYLAKGGMVDQGQMFVAREAGPEMVGTIGGRTAVANNDQIVSAVSAGVYSAVRDAMRESSGGEQHTTVNVDGDALFDFVVSKNRSQSVQYGYSPLLG